MKSKAKGTRKNTKPRENGESCRVDMIVAGKIVPECEELPWILHKFVEAAPHFRWPVQFCWCLVGRWNHDRCPLIAAALAFFGLLSVFPIVLAAVAIIASVLAGDQQVLESFRSFVEQFFPGASKDDISRQLTVAVEQIAVGPDPKAIGSIAVISALWSGRAYFDTLASVLNTIWPRAQPRSFWGHQLAIWGTFLGAAVLWLLSMGLRVSLAAIQEIAQELPDLFFNRQPLFWVWLGYFSTWFLTVIMFWVMYRFLPNMRGDRRGRLALVAAIVATILWEVAQRAFAGFFGKVSHYERNYGAFAGVVVTMMWLYVSSLIVVGAAEFAGAYEDTRAARRGEALPEKSCMPADQVLPPEFAEPV